MVVGEGGGVRPQQFGEGVPSLLTHEIGGQYPPHPPSACMLSSNFFNRKKGRGLWYLVG